MCKRYEEWVNTKKKKKVTNYLGPSDLKFCDAMKFYIQSFNTAHF